MRFLGHYYALVDLDVDSEPVMYNEPGRMAALGGTKAPALLVFASELGGFGTGLAIVGAYVLAGELLAADGDHRVAFPQYEDAFRDYGRISKKGNAGPFLAPGSRTRMRMRDWAFKSRFLLRAMIKATERLATDIDLKDYPALHRPPL